MRAGIVLSAVLATTLAFARVASAMPHGAARFEAPPLPRGPLRAGNAGSSVTAPNARLDRGPDVAPVSIPVAPKVEPHAVPATLKRPELPSPEPSPFANPLHRLLMADLSR